MKTKTSNEEFEQYLFRKYKTTIDFELAKQICSKDHYKYMVNYFLSIHQNVPRFLKDMALKDIPIPSQETNHQKTLFDNNQQSMS